MKDQDEGTRPLGKLLHLRLTEDEPEPIPRVHRVSPIVSLIGFIGCLVGVGLLLAWLFK